jgi:hypothetical protein
MNYWIHRDLYLSIDKPRCGVLSTKSKCFKQEIESWIQLLFFQIEIEEVCGSGHEFGYPLLTCL